MAIIISFHRFKRLCYALTNEVVATAAIGYWYNDFFRAGPIRTSGIFHLPTMRPQYPPIPMPQMSTKGRHYMETIAFPNIFGEDV